MIGIFFTGFYFIDKIYKIADPCKKQEIITTNNPKTFDAENALIFGNASFAEDIAAKMASRNISCTIINDITRLDRSLSYKYLVAAGEDDLDNLMLCSIVTKTTDIKKIIAICKCSYNKRIYEDNHVPYLSGQSISAAQIVSSLL
jgi:hypothetical protein